MRQRTYAIRLFEPRRYGSRKLPNVGVSDDWPYSPSGPAPSTPTTRHVCLYSEGRAPRVSLIEPPQIFLRFAFTPQVVTLWFNSLLAIKPKLLML